MDSFPTQVYTYVHLSLQVIAFICDVFLFSTITSFRCLNERFHYNLLKHCCCINASYLVLILSSRLLFKLSYDVTVASCTITVIVGMLFVTNYLALLLIALESTLSVQNQRISKKLRERKTFITAVLYLFMILGVCFGVRYCVLPSGEEEWFGTVSTFFVIFTAALCIASVHFIKRASLNEELRESSWFSLKISLVGFMSWLPQFVFHVSYSCEVPNMICMHTTYFFLFVGTLTPVYHLVLCLLGDRIYRGCVKYVFGCKAYYQLSSNENSVRMVECARI